MSGFLIDLLSSADFGFSLSSWILGASDCLNSDDCCFVPSAGAEVYQGPQNFGTVRFFMSSYSDLSLDLYRPDSGSEQSADPGHHQTWQSSAESLSFLFDFHPASVASHRDSTFLWNGPPMLAAAACCSCSGSCSSFGSGCATGCFVPGFGCSFHGYCSFVIGYALLPDFGLISFLHLNRDD